MLPNIILALIVVFVLSSNIYSDAGATDLVVDASSTVLEITAPSSIELDLTPSTSGVAFGTTDLSVSVGTNNPWGYQLLMSSTSTDLARTAALADNTTPVIPTMALASGVDGYNASDFESSSTNTYTLNKWGYKLSTDSLFVPMVANESIILKSTNTNANTSSTTLNFAAKVDSSQPAGTYSNTITLTAVVNPKPRYMQDPSGWRNEVANIGDYVEGVIDTRDGKTYTVARLADNKVWMTTNLDLTGGTKLYSDDSDVPSGHNRGEGANDNPYYTLPGSSTNGFDDNTVAFVYNSGNRTSACTSANTGCYSYYSWLAATAGGKDANNNAVTSNGGNAAYSICPAGWRLPTATTSNASATSNNNWKTGDFYALASAYGASLEGNYSDDSSATGGNFNTNAGPTSTLPKFLLGGYYYNSLFNGGGPIGGYWSATSRSSSNAYDLGFSLSFVSSAYSDGRRSGFSVRCILEDVTVNDISDVEYMQDFATLSPSEKTAVVNSMAANTNYALKDSRDGAGATARYTIAKLVRSTTVGGQPFNYSEVWMTTNLDLAGGTALYSDDSDVAAANTKASGIPYYTLPNSSNSGDSFSDDTVDYVYNSGNLSSTCTTPGCYSYYSWLAATAGGKDTNGSAVADYHNAPYSICPAGWRLPTSTTGNYDVNIDSNWKTGDFYALATAYGANLEDDYKDTSSVTGGNFNNNAGPGTDIPKFLLGGRYNDSSLIDGGSGGRYWSATSRYSPRASLLRLDSSGVYPVLSSNYRNGMSIRCILRQ